MLIAFENHNKRFSDYISIAEIITNNDVSVVELFNDYFTPKAPFEDNKDKKSEFPDATIILSIKDYI